MVVRIRCGESAPERLAEATDRPGPRSASRSPEDSGMDGNAAAPCLGPA